MAKLKIDDVEIADIDDRTAGLLKALAGHGRFDTVDSDIRIGGATGDEFLLRARSVRGPAPRVDTF